MKKAGFIITSIGAFVELLLIRITFHTQKNPVTDVGAFLPTMAIILLGLGLMLLATGCVHPKNQPLPFALLSIAALSLVVSFSAILIPPLSHVVAFAPELIGIFSLLFFAVFHKKQ